MFKMFKVGELFDIHPTTAYKMKNNELFASSGTTPVLSNSSMNNGIGGYCGLAPTEHGGMITFSDTTTGADTMFYQPNPFIGYPHVQGMYPYQPDRWNEKCYLYVISCIRKSAGNGWNYAMKFNRALVKELLIELPVIELPDLDHEYTVEDIDFEYMRDYIHRLDGAHIRQLEEEHIRRFDEYLRAADLESTILTPEEQEALRKFRAGEVMLRKYRISDLFDVKTTYSFNKNSINIYTKGDIDFIGRSSVNNGIQGKCKRESVNPNPANTFSVVQVGESVCLFREREWYASQNIFIMYPKNSDLSRNHLFIQAAVNKILGQMYKSAYVYPKLNDIKNLEISLPCLPSGTPDYALMATYIRALEKQSISRLDAMQKEEEKLTKKITKKR